MNKIISGALGLMAIVVVVSASAYALFTSQATINGIELQTGNAALLIRPAVSGATFSSSFNMPAGAFAKLIPGEDDWGQFDLKNDSSSSSVDPLNLNLTARLTSANGDWVALKDVIQAVVYVEGTTDYDTASATSTGWQTLNTWNTVDVNLPGDPLAPQAEEQYIVRYRLPQGAGNEVAGKSLTNVQFVFTGTQVTP